VRYLNTSSIKTETFSIEVEMLFKKRAMVDSCSDDEDCCKGK